MELQLSAARFNERLVERFVTWLGVRGLAETTQSSYGRAARSFADFLQAKSILAAEHSDALRYLTHLREKGLAKQTIFVYVEALRALQKFIFLAELPCTGALGRIAVPKIPSRVGDFLIYEQIERLIAAARSPIELALVELAFASACRISELAHIRVEQINWQERTIVVLGKGNKERVVLFGAPAEKALLAYLDGRTEGFLFRTERRKWIRSAPELFSQPRVLEGQPNKTIATVYWRACWREAHATGRVLTRYCWLGKKTDLTECEAQEKLVTLLAGKALTTRPRGPRATRIQTPRADSPLSVRHLSRIIMAVGRRAGLKVHPHMLRHACVTAMLNHGAGIREIQALLGHVAISTTARYLHSTTADLVETHRKFHPDERED